MNRYLSLMIVVTLTGLLACSARAVMPATWSHTTEKQFAEGKFEAAVVNARGDISLAGKSEILFGSQDAPPVISALVVQGGRIYAGAGNEPVIYCIEGNGKKGKKFRKFATLPGTMITSLFLRGNELLAGVGGDEGGIYSIDNNGKSRKLWSDKDVKYVWAIVSIRDGKLYAATGAAGRIYLIDAKGKAEVLYETGKLAKNILSIALAKDTLYAGTDEKGLVVAIDTRNKSSRVVLDAAEAEIAAIVPAPGGGLYVATSDVAKASPDGKTPPSNSGKNGKPATPSTKPSDKAKAPPAKDAPKKKAPAEKKPAAGGSSKPSRKMIVMMRSRAAGSKGGPPAPETAAAPKPGKGNAVYHIQPNGLVRTIFRKPVTILAMRLRNGELILATGNGGAVYSVTTDGVRTRKLIDTEAKQVTALDYRGENLIFATANKGSVGAIHKALAPKGSYTSIAMDAKQIVQWGTMRLGASSPDGAKATVATRSGNLAKPDEKTWSSWSKEQTVNGGFIPIMSPSARFLQYRLTLIPGRENIGPVVSSVAMIYQMANLPPIVSSVVFKTSSRPKEPKPDGPQKYRMITIQAADPNGDKLIYSLDYRRIGSETWVLITDKHAKPMYVWDTLSVGDGEYELRVTAKDSPTNVSTAALGGSRIAERIIVDNTPPVIEGLSAKATGLAAMVRGAVTDAGSRIVSIAYTIDSKDTWKTTLSSDGICDSGAEKLAIQIKDLDPGAHRIAVRVTDQYGNIGYGYTSVTVVKKK